MLEYPIKNSNWYLKLLKPKTFFVIKNVKNVIFFRGNEFVFLSLPQNYLKNTL